MPCNEATERGPAWICEGVIAHALVRMLIAENSTPQVDVLVPAPAAEARREGMMANRFAAEMRDD